MKKIIAMMLAAIMMLSLAACGDKTPDNPDDAKDVLVMGTSADYAPYEFMYPDANGEMVYGGIDISVAQAIAESMGKELEIQNMNFDLMLTNMQEGKCDIVLAAIEVTPDRLEQADFSDPYYTDLPKMIVVPADQADAYKTLKDFSGKYVGEMLHLEALRQSLDELHDHCHLLASVELLLRMQAVVTSAAVFSFITFAEVVEQQLSAA